MWPFSEICYNLMIGGPKELLLSIHWPGHTNHKWQCCDAHSLNIGNFSKIKSFDLIQRLPSLQTATGMQYEQCKVRRVPMNHKRSIASRSVHLAVRRKKTTCRTRIRVSIFELPFGLQLRKYLQHFLLPRIEPWLTDESIMGRPWLTRNPENN